MIFKFEFHYICGIFNFWKALDWTKTFNVFYRKAVTAKYSNVIVVVDGVSLSLSCRLMSHCTTIAIIFETMLIALLLKFRKYTNNKVLYFNRIHLDASFWCFGKSTIYILRIWWKYSYMRWFFSWISVHLKCLIGFF